MNIGEFLIGRRDSQGVKQAPAQPASLRHGFSDRQGATTFEHGQETAEAYEATEPEERRRQAIKSYMLGPMPPQPERNSKLHQAT